MKPAPDDGSDNQPDPVEAHYRRAAELHTRGDLDGAIAAYREGLRLSPSDPLAHINIGNALLKRGDGAAAVTEYRECGSIPIIRYRTTISPTPCFG
jgi:Flp pilus assembly protein TadD